MRRRHNNLSYDFNSQIENPERLYQPPIKKKVRHISISLDDYYFNEDNTNNERNLSEIYIEVEKGFNLYLSALMTFNSIHNEWFNEAQSNIRSISVKEIDKETKERVLKVNNYTDKIIGAMRDISHIVNKEDKKSCVNSIKTKISLTKKEHPPFAYNPPMIKNRNNSLLSIYKDISKYN